MIFTIVSQLCSSMSFGCRAFILGNVGAILWLSPGVTWGLLESTLGQCYAMLGNLGDISGELGDYFFSAYCIEGGRRAIDEIVLALGRASLPVE